MTHEYRGPMRFAHRGVTQAAPENTLEAFQAAVDAGYEGIEIDIRRTKDGQIVVVHDDNLARLTSGHPAGASDRRIEDMTWEELEKAELPYAGHLRTEDIPASPGQSGIRQEADTAESRMAKLSRFADFDKWVSGLTSDTTVEIEFKCAGLMPEMLRILEGSANRDKYILFSGEPEQIEEIQRVCAMQGKPEGIRLAANVRFLTDECKRKIAGMDLFEVGLNAGEYTADDVKYLHDRGIQVFSNLGDYPEWWEELCRTGAMGFKTNYPAAFTRWWNARYGS